MWKDDEGEKIRSIFISKKKGDEAMLDQNSFRG